MGVFRYRVFKDNHEIKMNWINAEDRQEAIEKLQEEYTDCEIYLTEVFGIWKCDNE